MNTINNILAGKEIEYVTPEDTGYPERLKTIEGKPKGLYYIGGLPEDDRPSVAIIGARNCSGYGRQMAREFAREIAGAGIQIISGMATGVDGIAQSAALAVGGKTFAVLGSGVDVCYPEKNRDLYLEIMDNGGVISELPVGCKPIARNFPLRNRIISGLSDAVLVIEARERSGTLITVGMALDQGREVYALPGRVNESLSYGCNRLIKEGATPLISPYDFVEEFLERYSNGKNAGEKADITHLTVAESKDNDEDRYRFLSANERAVLSVIDLDPKTVSEILYDLSEKGDDSDIGIPQLLGLLTDMTMKHLIECIDGSHYCRK